MEKAADRHRHERVLRLLSRLKTGLCDLLIDTAASADSDIAFLVE